MAGSAASSTFESARAALRVDPGATSLLHAAHGLADKNENRESLDFATECMRAATINNQFAPRGKRLDLWVSKSQIPRKIDRDFD